MYFFTFSNIYFLGSVEIFSINSLKKINELKYYSEIKDQIIFKNNKINEKEHLRKNILKIGPPVRKLCISGFFLILTNSLISF